MGIQVRGDLVQQQDPGVQNHCPGDGEQLKLSLGEQDFGTGRMDALGKLIHRFAQAHHVQGLPDLRVRHLRVKQGYLVANRAGHQPELLFHIAEPAALFAFRDRFRRPAKHPHSSLPGLIQSCDQLDQRTLSRTGAPGQDDGFTLCDSQAEVMEDLPLLLAITKAHIAYPEGNAVSPDLPRAFFLLCFFQKFIDPPHAGHRRLHILDLHADAFKWAEEITHISDHRRRGTGGHPEKQLYRAAFGGGRHHNADQQRADRHHNGRIDGVIEVGMLLRPVALLNGIAVTLQHIGLPVQDPDGAHIVQCFRDLLVGASHRDPVFHLGFQHPFLERSRHPKKKRRDRQQQKAQAGAFHKNDDKNAHQLAKVSRHADDAGGKQVVHGIHIVDKPGCRHPRLSLHKIGGGEAFQLFTHDRPDVMGHLLAEGCDQAFFRCVQQPGDGHNGKVSHRHGKQDRFSRRQGVHNFFQHQGRQKGEPDGKQDGQKQQHAQPQMFSERIADDPRHGRFSFHPMPPPSSGLHRASCNGRFFVSVPRGWRQ